MHAGVSFNSRGPKGGYGARMPQGGWKTIARVLRYVFTGYRWSLLTVLLCIVVSSVTTLASTLFTRSLIDDYIVPLTAQLNPDFQPLAHALTTLALVLVVGACASYVQSLLTIRIGQGVLLRLRCDLFSHMQQLPIPYFDRHAHGNLMSVYTNDVDTLRQLVSQTMPEVFSSSITIAMTLVSMCILSWQLTLLVLVMTTAMVFVTRWLGQRSARHFHDRQERLGTMNGYIEEMLTGLKVVKTFGHEQQAMSQFSTLNEQLRSSTYHANREANIVMPVNGNLSNLIYVLCAIVGAVLVIGITHPAATLSAEGTQVQSLFSVNQQLQHSPATAALTIGTLVSFLTLVKNFTRPVSQVSQQVNSLVMALAGAGRVFDLMDAEAERDELADVTLVNLRRTADGSLAESAERTGAWAWKTPDGLVPQRGEVDFSHVDFGYVTDKQVLFDIDLDTDAGQKVALVGGTGAGKTTITNLINRFYDIQHGTILYDGIDIRRIHRRDLRRSLGMVLQETHLFTATVMENIRYGRLDATDDECREAARLAGADDFIRRLPQGYDTLLSGDGGNLSQGERQLLAIARAAVANPPAMILDEATSSIDTRTESLVQRGMDRLMQGRSSFVIAHRLSTVRNADIIVVMDHGRIVERGTHEQLLQLGGTYAQLYRGNQID